MPIVPLRRKRDADTVGATTVLDCVLIIKRGGITRFPFNRLDWAMRPFDLFFDPGVGQRGRWILYSALIGTVSGLGAILFDLAFRQSERFFLGGIGTFIPPGSGIEGGPGHLPDVPWLIPLSLVVGGLISGALVYFIAPEAEGHGTDAVIRSFHHLRGKIRRRVPIVKAISSAITIGSGGSAGREGPIAQIGAGFGSYLADLLKLTNHDRRILMKPVIGPLLPTDDLARAARLLASRQADSVVVVQSRERPEILGMFTRHDLVVAYGMHIEKVQKDRPEDPDISRPF